MNRKKISILLTIIIPIIGLLVSIADLMLGENILARFSSPEIVLSSTKVDLTLPSSLNRVLTKYADDTGIHFLPDTIRLLHIKNIGSIPSRNLKMNLKFDGNIYDYKITSTEDIKKKDKVDNSTLNIYVDRFTKNAYMDVIVWLKENSEAIDAFYVDDVKTKKFVQNDNRGQFSNNIVMVLIFLISTVVLLSQWLINLITKITNSQYKANMQFVSQLREMFAKQGEILENSEEYEDKEQIKTRIEQFIKETKDM